VDADNTLQERTVATGLQTANDIEITSGLNPGDRVVISDRSGLKSGQRVRPQVVEVQEYRGAQ